MFAFDLQLRWETDKTSDIAETSIVEIDFFIRLNFMRNSKSFLWNQCRQDDDGQAEEKEIESLGNCVIGMNFLMMIQRESNEDLRNPNSFLLSLSTALSFIFWSFSVHFQEVFDEEHDASTIKMGQLWVGDPVEL